LCLVVFFVFFPMVPTEIQYGNGFGVKPEKLLLQMAFSLPQVRFFSPTPKQWEVTFSFWWLGMALARNLSQKSASKKLRRTRKKFFLKMIKNSPKRAKNQKMSVVLKVSNANMPLCWIHLKHLAKTFLTMFYLSTYLQWFASYRRKTVEQDDVSASAIPKGF